MAKSGNCRASNSVESDKESALDSTPKHRKDTKNGTQRLMGLKQGNYS